MATTMTLVAGLKTRNFLHKPPKMPLVKLDDLPPMEWTQPAAAVVEHVWNDDVLLHRLFADHPNYLDGLNKALTAMDISPKEDQDTITIETATHVDWTPQHLDMGDNKSQAPSHTTNVNQHRYKYFAEESHSLTCSTDSESHFDASDAMSDITESDVESISDVDEGESEEEEDEDEEGDEFDYDVDQEARDGKETKFPMEATTMTTSLSASPLSTQEQAPTTPKTCGRWTLPPTISSETKPTAPRISVPPLTPCLYTKKQLKLLRPSMSHETIILPSPTITATAATADEQPQSAVVADASTALMWRTLRWPREEPSKEPFVPKTSLQRAVLQMIELKKKRLMMLNKNASAE